MFGLRDVEFVREVVRAGGFRAAAQQFGISQSAISTRIATLERRLGFLIFDRAQRRVRLTARGRRFIEEAERLVLARDRLVEELTRTQGLDGTVRIGVAETIVHTMLTPMLNALRKDRRTVRFELSVDTSEQLSRHLIDDRVDVAILLKDFLPKAAVSVPLKPIALGWYCAADLDLPRKALTPHDLARYPIVTFPKTTPPYREIERLLSAPDIAAPILHGSASLSTVIHLIGDNFGIGALPRRMAEDPQLGARLKAVNTTPAARLNALHFVVAYIPERNQDVGAAVAKAARDCDRSDL